VAVAVAVAVHHPPLSVAACLEYITPHHQFPVVSRMAASLSPDQLEAVAKAARQSAEGADGEVKPGMMQAAMMGGVLGASSSPPQSNKLGEETKIGSEGEVSATAPPQEEIGLWNGMVNKVQGGNVPLRYASILGGVAMIASGWVCFIADVATISFVSALIDFYIFLFGCIVLLLEFHLGTGKKSWLPNIAAQAKFLTYVSGRGLFYFFVGSLSLSQWKVWSVVTGVYMMLLGIGMMWYGHRASRGLKRLREKLVDADKLHELFGKYDADNNGGLDPREFALLCSEMDVGLTPADVEAAMVMLDTSNDGKIQFAELEAWWRCFMAGKLGSEAAAEAAAAKKEPTGGQEVPSPQNGNEQQDIPVAVATAV
jgi:hypothetical protein